MKQYDFNGKIFQLVKNTFYTERRAKEVAEITETLESEFLRLIQKQKILIEQIGNVKEDKRDTLLESIDSNGLEIERVSKLVEWHNDPDKIKKVFKVILIGDVDSLTEQDFGKFDAQEVWQDFFTKPSPTSNDSKNLTGK